MIQVFLKCISEQILVLSKLPLSLLQHPANISSPLDPVVTCSESTIEALAQYLKYVQS